MSNVSTVHTTATTVTYRPQRIRWIAGIVATVIVVGFTLIAFFGLHGSSGFDDNGTFQRGDRPAMIGVGLLLGWGVLTFCRPRITAGADGVKVRNVVGGYELPWSVVRAVRFDRTSQFAQLDLHDDEQVAVHALQAWDKDYAVEAVRALRGLHRAAVGE